MRSARVQTEFPKLGCLTFEEPDTRTISFAANSRAARGRRRNVAGCAQRGQRSRGRSILPRGNNFPEITETVANTMERHKVIAHPTLKEILEADAWAREEAGRITQS